MASQQELVEKLFEAALELKPADRGAFLDREGGDDPGLRRAVEELLADDARAGSFLQHPPLEDLDKADLFDQVVGEQTLSVDSYGIPPIPTGRLKPGEIMIDRFIVLRFIAKGGMGEVYEVEDRFLQGVHVALKTILPHFADDPALKQRFEREVLLAREITHRNLCPIYEIFHNEQPPPGFLFLTMKLLPGETLAVRLKGPNSISVNEGLAILKQMAAGLIAIHDAGIVHRDIKPNNIMLDGSGQGIRLWITDFGLARALEVETTLQAKGAVAGTPGYIAPELMLGHSPSQATDLFAFGVVLHEIFTGQKPAAMTDRSSVLVNSRINASGVPSFCLDLVRGCLDQDPKRRCQAFDQALVPLGLKPRQRQPWTRRQFISTTAAGICSLWAVAWWEWDKIDDFTHPLPDKRFVALMAWPPSSSGAIVSSVLDSIGQHLARAEAYVVNLLIISSDDLPSNGSSPTTPAESVSTLGANLVLAAALRSAASKMILTLQVLDAATQKVLRSGRISCVASELSGLAGKGSAVALRLLGLPEQETSLSDPDELRHLSPDVFRSFSDAEHLADEPNNTGLNAAIVKYQEALAANPHFALGYARLAIAYIRQHIVHGDPGTLALANSNAELALHYNPDSAKVLLSQALAYLYSGKTDKAIEFFGKSLRADPGNPETLLYEAQAYRDLNHWPKAEKVYREIIKERPNYWPAYNELGQVLYQQAKYREAADAFGAAAAAAPSVALPLANLSTMYMAIGKTDEARDASVRSLKVHATSAAYLNLGDIAFSDGHYSEARDNYERAAALDPRNHIVWRNIGDCYTMLGPTSKVRESYAKAAEDLFEDLKAHPGYSNGWMTLAFYDAKMGNSSEARTDIAKAESLGAADVESQFMKAQALALLGKKQEALDLVLACIDKGLSPLEVDLALDLKDIRTNRRYLNRVEQLKASEPR